jgi:hypothetical protein
MPEAARQPGVVACDDCRIDPRKHRQAHEHRRRLRKYGLDQDSYDQLLIDQDGRCAGCRTAEPGAKGWCIDHCHSSGKVRGLMCNRCNTILGLANEDPAVLRLLADFLERLQVIDRDKDIV